jgi:hypothetical protein
VTVGFVVCINADVHTFFLLAYPQKLITPSTLPCVFLNDGLIHAFIIKVSEDIISPVPLISKYSYFLQQLNIPFWECLLFRVWKYLNLLLYFLNVMKIF